MRTIGDLRVKSVRRSGLRSEVYHSIVAMLTEDELLPGSALRVEALAEMLDVSPTPVREALVQLEATGLVDYVANKGYSVAALPSADETRELMDARLVLEVAASRRAASREERGFAAELHSLADAQEAASGQLSDASLEQDRALIREYLRLDHAFHDLIFRESGNSYLARLAKTMDAQSQRTRQAFRHGIGDAPLVVAEHREIADAISAADIERAERAVSKHLMRVLDQALHQG